MYRQNMDIFTQLFGFLLLICIATEWISRKDDGTRFIEAAKGFKSFQFSYLIVYITHMAADWLQGPYIYALYESYGFYKDEIAMLFLCGFFSSMVFGTFIGGIADKYGRKFMCLMFGVLYGASCITKFYRDFYILMFGRLLGGISTSLLFSVFEAWMVHEHHKRGYSPDALTQTFSYATFGNGCVAILSSLAASYVAGEYGFVGPYMLSLVLLVFGTLFVGVFWPENYGDSSANIKSTFSNAISVIRNDNKVAILGLVQSLFEASMYTFVFMWTPALTEGSKFPLPHGLIFACYMLSIMIGSSLFKILVLSFEVTAESLAPYIFGIAGLSLLIPTFTASRLLITISFIMFEVMCGMYWPCLSTLRGTYVPESTRAALMNFFRVPLNFLVVLVLTKVSSLATSTVFVICAFWLFIAFAGQLWFNTLIPRLKRSDSKTKKKYRLHGKA